MVLKYPSAAARAAIFGSMVFVLIPYVASSPLVAQEIQYNRDVRPILAENCFACHGFDHAKREAGLRLDTADGATASLESGEVAIRPGSPDESEAIRRIFSADHDEMMPPSESGKTLSEQQKQILQTWVAQGARYDKHWSFIMPEKARLPADERQLQVAHPIDQFVRIRLLAAGLSPSPEADRIALLRRVSLDLTGLPPSPEQVQHFLAASEQDSDGAYSEVVDRLLQSPAYGERWGRWWLDQARYADSNGYSVDAPRQIWKYRDWVIEVLNRDLPFDQFTVEPLAGDLLPNATDEQRVATGFHRNT